MKTCHDNLFIFDSQVTLFMSRNQCIELSHLQSFANFVSYSDVPAEFHWFLKWSTTNVSNERQIMPTLYFFSRALHVEHYQIYELCSHKRKSFLDTTGPHFGRILETRLVCSCEDISVASQFVTVAERWNPLSPVFEISFFVWRDLTWLTILSHSSTKCSLFHIS